MTDAVGSDQEADLTLRLTRYNLPGLTSLSYRGNRYNDSVARMVANLAQQTVTGDAAGRAPLANLNSDGYGDWTIALLQAWAAILEVLAFYQERIVNEGYLRTATERRSVLELARTLGYELRPGTAASSHLVLTVLADKTQPHRLVEVPAGAAVQSVPPPGQLPQTFEINQAFVAHVDWNALKLATGAQSARLRLRATTSSAQLAGTQTRLQPGDYLLILDGPLTAGSNQPFLLVQVASAQPDPAQGCTHVAWTVVTQSDPAPATLQDARLFALRDKAGLFGYTQGGIYLADASAAGGAASWAPAGVGLPHAAVYALAAPGDGHLVAGTAQGMFHSTDRGAAWQPVEAGLVHKPVLTLASGGETLYAGATEGTVYVSRSNGRTWTVLAGETVLPPLKGLSRLWSPPDKGMLPKVPVRALAAYARGRASRLAAGTDAGLFRSADGGRSWQPTDQRLPPPDPKSGQAAVAVRALAVKDPDGRPQLYAGTDVGVFHIAESPSRWFIAAVLGVVALLLASRITEPHLVSRLAAAAKNLAAWGTDIVNGGLQSLRGLLQNMPDLLARIPANFQAPRIPDPADTLKPLFEKIPQVGASLVARYDLVTDTLALFVVFAALVIAVQWLRGFLASRSSASLGRTVFALVVGPHGHLFAATASGVFRSNDGLPHTRVMALLGAWLRWLLGDGVRRWQPAGHLGGVAVRSLAVTPDALLAGAADGRVFTSKDDGVTWAALGDQLPVLPVLAVGAIGSTIIAGGEPPPDPIERLWAPAQLAARQVDLERVAPAMAPGSWVILRPAAQPAGPDPAVAGVTPPPAALYQVEAAATTAILDVTRPGATTRLVVDQSNHLAAMDRRTTQVLGRSELLPLFDDQPLTGDRLVLNTVAPGLEAGQRLVVSGKLKRLRVTRDAPVSWFLTAENGLRREPFQPGESLQVVAVAAEQVDGTRTWLLRNRDGFTGSAQLRDEVLLLDPSRLDDGLVSEIVVLQAAIDNPTQTTLRLEAPVVYAYDPATVTIYGNVVRATHGQKVARESLSSDDNETTRQGFALKQAPLTYVAGLAGVESTLAIQVNDVAWRQAPTLHGHDGNDRIFVVRQDAAGRSKVIFGDGLHGAAVPRGVGAVTASYRRGSGAVGNVAANSLKLLQTAVPGIQAVINPLPAQGGNDAESADDARAQAPLVVRAMERIVSLADVEDFTRRFPGVGKAAAQVMTGAAGSLLHVTIAGTSGNTVARESDFVRALAGAINAARATPRPIVTIDGYEPVYFNIRATLLLEPDHVGRREAILAEAREVLAHSFTFARREFAQPVAASEVVSLLQNITGVKAVALQALHGQDEAPALHNLLAAQPARWVGEQVRPAQMLLVNAAGPAGIDLEAE